MLDGGQQGAAGCLLNKFTQEFLFQIKQVKSLEGKLLSDTIIPQF